MTSGYSARHVIAEPANYKNRMTALMVTCVTIGAVLIARAGYLQIGTDPRLEKMAKRQFQSKVLMRPRRGLVVDRTGEPLAANVETNSLAANPSKIQNKRTMARLLSKAMGIPYARILPRLTDKKEFIWIKRHLDEGEMTKLKRWKIVDSDGELMSGLWLVKESQRVYPHRELAANILGDVNVDSEGLEGVELWMNEKLRGKVVSMSAIKDALGRPAFIDSVVAKNMEEGRDGESVSLTIDASLQFAIEEELRNAIRKSNAKAGTVIAMNAVNGEILALANYPSYNPNQKGAPAEHKRNRAVTDGFEPGSTLKAVLLASALSNGFKLSDQIHGENGSFKVQGKRISEAETHEKFKMLSLKRMIQVSSNVVAAKLALNVGADRYRRTLRDFGFASKTNIGFPGEISGRMPGVEQWTPLALANIGFGQGILVTPIQMTRAYAAFLNGGWLVQPTLVKSIGETESPPGEAPRRVLSEKVSEQVLQALEAVVLEGGTAEKAALAGYRVAGKTGTAQKVDPATGKYSRSKYIASFIGYALDVEPKVVIFAAIDEPQGNYYATERAAPLFREVLNAVASRFSLPTNGSSAPLKLAKNAGSKLEPKAGAAVNVAELLPAETEIERDQVGINQAKAVTAPSASAAQLPADEGDQLRWQGATGAGRFLWKMPQLRGLTPREAVQALAGHHFYVQMQGAGIIAEQVPEPGKLLADGDTVRLTLREP